MYLLIWMAELYRYREKARNTHIYRETERDTESIIAQEPTGDPNTVFGAKIKIWTDFGFITFCIREGLWNIFGSFVQRHDNVDVLQGEEMKSIIAFYDLNTAHRYNRNMKQDKKMKICVSTHTHTYGKTACRRVVNTLVKMSTFILECLCIKPSTSSWRKLPAVSTPWDATGDWGICLDPCPLCGSHGLSSWPWLHWLTHLGSELPPKSYLCLYKWQNIKHSKI